MKHIVLALSFVMLGTVARMEAQLKINLDNLASKAKAVVDLSLDSSMLHIAGQFLSSEKSDEAKAKAAILGLKGVYVKSFEFDKEGQYTPDDLKPIRAQLQAPGWSRVVNVVDRSEGAEIYLKTEEGKTAGLTVLAWEAKALTIVQIIGPINLDQLSELGGKFGIPPVAVPKITKKPAQ
jgi:hypothetical protein